MLKREFIHQELKLIVPSYESELTDLILGLESLRGRRFSGTTPPHIFFQMKGIFHTLESIGSARIEGNNTTIAEYIGTERDTAGARESRFREIANIERAMDFIEDTADDVSLDRAYICELHRIAVEGLPLPPDGEGDLTPGMFRTVEVSIARSEHQPPTFMQVDEYMQELTAFMAEKTASKYDLMKTALAHHRFAWIHPFRNGNGRVVRLLTYAMLARQGFNVHEGRLINPTAVFCSDRNRYYRYLAKADSEGDAGKLAWCAYVLGGLREEIEKLDRLADYPYLVSEIILPAIEYAHDNTLITDTEKKVLLKAATEQSIQASDLKDIFKGKQSSEISRQIRRMIDKKLLVPEKENGRRYHLHLGGRELMRGVFRALDERGFLPLKGES